MYHGTIQQLSGNTGNKLRCPFPFIISQVWNELIIAECRVQMILSLDKHSYRVIPRPLACKCPLPVSNDECDCFDLRLTLLNWSLRSSWDWELNCPLGFWCRAFNDLCSLSTKSLFVIWWTITTTVQLLFCSVDLGNFLLSEAVKLLNF